MKIIRCALLIAAFLVSGIISAAQEPQTNDDDHIYPPFGPIVSAEMVHSISVTVPDTISIENKQTCYVTVVIGSDGTLTKIENLSCSEKVLYDAMAESIGHASFKSATFNGNPVRSMLYLYADFHKKHKVETIKVERDPQKISAFFVPPTTSTGNGSSQTTGGVYQIAGDITKPQLLQMVDPQFTDAARRDHANGAVLVGLIVDAHGIPQNVHVVKSFRPDLDANAVAAVKQYTFKPATKNGVPVPVQLQVFVNFRIFR